MSSAPSTGPRLKNSSRIADEAAVQRWVILSTFDSMGKSSESTVAQIRSYRRAGFKVLVIDTSAGPCETRQADWTVEATRWVCRANVGYDFGSFKAGLEHLVAEEGVRAGEVDLLFTNDSCFGPFIPIEPILDRFDGLPRGQGYVFGITDSVQELHHIQSYWIYFRSDVSHLATEFFLQRMSAASDRNEAITMGELSLGQFLLSRNCRLEALCPVRATLHRLASFNGWLASMMELGLRRAVRRWKYTKDLDTLCLRYLLRLPDKVQYFNPIVLFGVQLHRLRLCPFVKKSMFRENVYSEPAISSGIDASTLTNVEVERMLR